MVRLFWLLIYTFAKPSPFISLVKQLVHRAVYDISREMSLWCTGAFQIGINHLITGIRNFNIFQYEESHFEHQVP